MFGTKLHPSDINCDGCRQNEGRRFSHRKSCTIHLCTMGKGLKSCGLCSDYSCEKLKGLLAILTTKEPRKNLEAIGRVCKDGERLNLLSECFPVTLQDRLTL